MYVLWHGTNPLITEKDLIAPYMISRISTEPYSTMDLCSTNKLDNRNLENVSTEVYSRGEKLEVIKCFPPVIM